ncbi:hypothetical protein CLD22_02610 [Rubrivivax gelatinosus]|nr:hypothetical protein [Rubrivivax gelatinosus]
MSESAEIESFLDKYSPEIAAQLREARSHLAGHFPRGFELVYDNYNALVFAFGASDRSSGAVLSLAGYPGWVTLFFADGRALDDPGHLLEGAGVSIRSLRLKPLARLYEPGVQALIAAAKGRALELLAGAPPLSTVVKSISARHRARRPAADERGSR